MQRMMAILNVSAMLLAACAALTTVEAAAEPIPGADLGNYGGDAPAQPPELTAAVGLFKARDYDGALESLKKAVKKSADLPPAQVIMAQLFSQAEMPEKVKTALERAAIDEPNDPEAYALMAGIAFRRREAAKAESLYRKADSLMTAFDKSDSRKKSLQLLIHGGLADVAEARKDWAAAQAQLEASLKADPANGAIAKRLAYCLLQQKNVKGALEKLREAAKADPETLAPEAVLAQLCQKAGDAENAKKWMAAALAAAPKSVATRLAVVQWALETQQLDEAMKQVIAAMEMAPDSREVEFFRGLVALCQKDYRTSESYLEPLFQRQPDNVAISNNLALALIGQNDETKKRRALEIAEGNARKFPKSALTASTYGWVLYRLGRLDDSEKALRPLCSPETVSIDTAYYMARVQVDRGRKADKAEAKQLLEAALNRPGGGAMFRGEAEDLLRELK